MTDSPSTRPLQLALAVALALFLVGGCIQVPETINVNVGQGESGENGSETQEGSGGWTDVLKGIGGQMVDAEYGVLFYAFDTLAYPEEPVDVAARLQSAKNFKALTGATLGFYQAEQLIGTAQTDKDGYGRISWQPPKAGDYEFTVRVLQPPEDDDYQDALKVTPAPLLVAAREKNTELAIVDLDRTVVDASFLRVLMGDAKPMEGSVDVMHKLAERYTIVYLTHRPNILTRKSKSWLSENDYPRGPLLVSELKQAFGDSGKFKTAKLKALQASFPNPRIGIGDKLSDAQAYVDSGMTAYLIPHYNKKKPKDMRKVAQAIRQLKGRARLHVVGSWQEIEEGVFQDRSFPPQAFANQLDAEADRLQAAKGNDPTRQDDD
ncbi:MAG TPA: hypothetical protein VM098_07370 [Phycisphaerae bacterium]|nr:hypothetical protein [Phycisphaerae bacterium]